VKKKNSISYKVTGISLIVALLLLIVTAVFINLTSTRTKLLAESNLIDTNQLYLLAVQVEQSPVAIVNNQKISAEEFNKFYVARDPVASSGLTIKDVKKALQLKCEIVNKLIIEKLVEQEAAKRDITASEQEIDARIAALKRTFPNQDKYNRHIARLPGGEDYIRRVAKSNILKDKLVEHEAVRGDDIDNDAQKTPDPANKKKVKKSRPTNASGVLIQRLKAKAEITNLLDDRHMILLRQTRLVAPGQKQKGLANIEVRVPEHLKKNLGGTK